MAPERDTTLCKSCNKSRLTNGVQNWVQCDSCKEWYHFACAGVDDSIARVRWTCDLCMHVDRSSSTSTRAAIQPNESENAAPNKDAAILSMEPNSNKPAETSFTQTSNNLMMAMLEETRESERKYIEQKYAILAQQQGMQERPIQLFGPTSSQLAARQILPADLPTFNGNPADWPIFISMYENSSSVAGFTDAENMLRLQKSLKGKAYELVRDKLLLPALVPEVINTLITFFGRPEQILDRLIDKIRKITVHKDRLESLIDFAMAVRNACATMEACNLYAHLDNPMLLRELVDKLPTQHKLSWALHPRSPSIPVVKSFSDWIYHLAEAASTVMPGQNSWSVNTNTQAFAGEKHQAISDSEDDQQQDAKPNPACVMCNSTEHYAAQCEKFLKLTVPERQRRISDAKACYRCLKTHRRKCFSKRNCGVDNCQSKHHPLLHRDAPRPELVSAHHKEADFEEQYFRILPVTLYGNRVRINTYAFLDEGSSVTLIDEGILKHLKVCTSPEPLCLQWTSNTTRTEETSFKARMQISEMGSGRKLWLNNVHSVKHLALPKQTVDVNKLVGRYNHLHGLPIKSYYNAEPMLLIGANNWTLAVPRKIREGRRNEPIASKCTLGWSIQGTSNANRNYSFHHCVCNWNDIEKAVRESFNADPIAPRELFSKDDEKAKGILEETCKKVNGRYQIGLLWRDKNLILPESYSTALKRLECLRQKINKNPELFDQIQNQIDNLVVKNYAIELQPADTAEDTNRVWYLPIFIALNPNKPNKIRLVWDAAAKSHGKSLNDFMLTGPDYLNSLTEVLMAFRVGRIGVCADIAEMFHQIIIQQSDMHVQRFLWLHKDNKTPRIFVMRAMTFGICCAPCIAHYVRDKNAQEFKDHCPRAFESITEAHYVDDLIDSYTDDSEAIAVTTKVRDIHAEGGFTIRNWISNSTAVLKHFGERQIDEQSPKELGDPEKVLGMNWEPSNDVFKYTFRFARLKRDVLNGETVPTKREALQVLMSIFDPLGLLSCYTIGLKMLLQKVWRAGIDWDEELPDTLLGSWRQWKTVLLQAAKLEFPRFYSTLLPNADQIDLHTFVDASEYAYAAVAYLRIKQGADIDTVLVAAKCKVAPLKPVSIPRMELLAAVMGVNLAKKVINIRRLNINSSTYWSNSTTVLQWLDMDPRKFQAFVMHRVGEIIDQTSRAQWRWIPTKENVADSATKLIKSPKANRWLKGPQFLA
ncbi:uncharacterized protein [Drosophila kikkawai]|uniref:PHD-type domain-containing protein n=1 Tax=Drosophila kikkawai TaxID=30033 RepID=A0ABM3C797_DROKI|nr:uncharacterized protein LOC121502812 [Drosophila kikkawai]